MKEHSNLLRWMMRPFLYLVERIYPDPFTFVIALTGITALAAWGATAASALEIVRFWGEGLASLLSFAAQIAFTVVTAHALAHTGPVLRILRWVAGRPRRSGQAYFLVALVAGLASLIAWPLGLIAGAILAKRVAIVGQAKGLKLDYPLLIASAYAGFVVWHMGYSGSAPLFVATPGHSLEAIVGIIEVNRTIFSVWNIAIAAVTLTSVSVLCALMQPAKDNRTEIDIHKVTETNEKALPADTAASFGERLGRMRLLTGLLGGALAIYLGQWFFAKGFTLDLNIVNWTLLCLGLLLARSPLHYARLATEGGRSLGPILLQYPLYAGIMGLMASSGLVSILSDFFVSISGPKSLAFWAFLSGGAVNFFVPSGGGQWAIQGPIFIEAAQALGVDPALIVMAVAYGDQWTNMIQPFWTIPLLAIAGLGVKDIFGYTFMVFLLTFFLFTFGLTLTSYFL